MTSGLAALVLATDTDALKGGRGGLHVGTRNLLARKEDDSLAGPRTECDSAGSIANEDKQT